jgi:hypothetical protein
MGEERAGAAVEMAMLLPLLVILVMGIIDVGRILFTNITIHEAAQEGAYFGAFNAGDPNEVRARVTESVDRPDLTDANAQVNVFCLPADDDNPERIQVQVLYDLDLLTPIMGEMIGSPRTLDEDVIATVISGGPCVES